MDAKYANIPKMTELIRTALLAWDICLVAQVCTLAVIFSTRDVHSTLDSLLAMIGFPGRLEGAAHVLNLFSAGRCVVVHRELLL